MSFKCAAGLWIAIVCSVYVHQARAAEVVLTARPGLCLVETIDDEPCVMSVLLDWQALTPGDFCLYHSADDELPLQCWNMSQNGGLRHHLSSREHVQYWLKRAGNDKRLAPITVRVVGVNQRNPKRRRRRHPWSVF